MAKASDVPAVADAAVDTDVTDEVTLKLRDLGVSDDLIAKIKEDHGVVTVADLSMLKESHFIASGLKTVQVQKLLGAFTPVATVVDPTSAFEVLPSVPDDASWLSALRAGGVLKVD